MISSSDGLFAALALLASTSACGEPLVCVGREPAPAISAVVRDSISNQPAARFASLIALRDTLYDSTRDDGPLGEDGTNPANDLDLVSRLYGPGTYDVRVRRDGYQLWQQTGIVITGDACGLGSGVRLQVRLQPVR